MDSRLAKVSDPTANISAMNTDDTLVPDTQTVAPESTGTESN